MDDKEETSNWTINKFGMMETREIIHEWNEDIASVVKDKDLIRIPIALAWVKLHYSASMKREDHDNNYSLMGAPLNNLTTSTRLAEKETQIKLKGQWTQNIWILLSDAIALVVFTLKLLFLYCKSLLCFQ